MARTKKKTLKKKQVIMIFEIEISAIKWKQICELWVWEIEKRKWDLQATSMFGWKKTLGFKDAEWKEPGMEDARKISEAYYDEVKRKKSERRHKQRKFNHHYIICLDIFINLLV